MKVPISALLMFAVAALSGCSGVFHSANFPASRQLAFTIVHINDHHSQLASLPTTEFTLDGVATRSELGGFARVTSAFKTYAGRNDVLKLHAGDAITGSLYYTLFQGEANAAMMNDICFDALAVGNHEFDNGDAGLRRFIDALRSDTCRTPLLTANIMPAIGTPLAPRAQSDYLHPYASGSSMAYAWRSSA